MKTRFVVVFAAAVGFAVPLDAADRLSGPQTAAACAPVPASTLRQTALRITGGQDVAAVRELYAAGTLVVISGGTTRGIRPDLRYYLRREPTGRGWPDGPRVATTTGWLRIVSATESTALGRVEFACDGVMAGDLLQPYVDPALPSGAERPAATGEPDFKAPAACCRATTSAKPEREETSSWWIVSSLREESARGWRSIATSRLRACRWRRLARLS